MPGNRNNSRDEIANLSSLTTPCVSNKLLKSFVFQELEWNCVQDINVYCAHRTYNVTCWRKGGGERLKLSSSEEGNGCIETSRLFMVHICPLGRYTGLY